MMQPLLIRADASTQIGTGHVMRCLALAQAWQDMGDAAHITVAQLLDGLVARLAAEGIGTNVHYIPVHLHSFYHTKYGHGSESTNLGLHFKLQRET